MQRRSFLASILAAGVAPAAVGSGILMPVRTIATPYTWGIDVVYRTIPGISRPAGAPLYEEVTGWEWRQDPMEFIDKGLVDRVKRSREFVRPDPPLAYVNVRPIHERFEIVFPPMNPREQMIYREWLKS
jgi:hypothetical protein